MLATDVVPACEARGHEVVALPRAALDITDGRAVEEAMSRHRPDAVINCAAWTSVDEAESHESEATQVNDKAAALLAATAHDVGARFVFLSTDYVFDGEKGLPYVESDQTNPVSAYGRSKLGGETSAAIANPDTFVVRSSWLFGRNGRNFVDTMLALAESEPEVLVVSDQIGCPTYTGHFAEALAELIEGDEYGIHHVAGSGECSWFEFAQEIFDQSGLETKVMAASSEMLARPAPRPGYSVLRSERRPGIELPHWRRGLAEYLARRQAVAA
jgi:dTDP-4-dehydrorhamnose reductase